MLLNNKVSNTVSAGFSKGFYITKHYHKLDVGGNVSYAHDAFPTVVNHQTSQYTIQKISGNIEVGFMPQSFFIKEITVGSKMNYQRLLLDAASINNQSEFNHYITFASSTKKQTGNLHWKNRCLKVQVFRFAYPTAIFLCDINSLKNFRLA